jgi:hypothetical protein
MEKGQTVRYKIPLLDRERLWTDGNIFFMILIGILLIAVGAVATMEFNLTGNLFVGLIVFLSIFYLAVILFTLEPKILREVIFKDFIETQKEVVTEVIKEVPKQIVHEMDRTIYVTNPRKKLNIHKYEYVGSSETKKYHKRNCRLGKLIKRKYKVSKDSAGYFKNKGYIQCKMCLDKKKKK